MDVLSLFFGDQDSNQSRGERYPKAASTKCLVINGAGRKAGRSHAIHHGRNARRNLNIPELVKKNWQSGNLQLADKQAAWWRDLGLKIPSISIFSVFSQIKLSRFAFEPMAPLIEELKKLPGVRKSAHKKILLGSSDEDGLSWCALRCEGQPKIIDLTTRARRRSHSLKRRGNWVTG